MAWYMISKNKIIYALFVLVTAVILFFGSRCVLQRLQMPQKFGRADFMTHFKVRYLEQPETQALEVLSCDISQDDFYKNNEDNCHLLSQVYGELIDKSYVAPLYIAFVSPELGYGLFADRALQKGEMIGEYTGNLVKESEVSENNKYLFYYPSIIDKKSENPMTFFIDAEASGNFTRFANHRANPNAERRYVAHNGKWRIIFIVVKEIVKNEQIFIDYGSGYWGDTEPLEITD